MENLRVQVEAQEMRRVFPEFSLWQDDDGQYFWEGRINGTRFRIKYQRNSPVEPPIVFDEPRLSTRHRFPDGRLCVLKNEEWNSNFTAATMVGTVKRFIHDFQHGLTE